MKVKIFNSYPSQVERDLNKWLGESKIEILHIVQSSADGNTIISIFYK